MNIEGKLMAYDVPKLFDEICSRIALGESVRSICRSEGMPSRKIIHAWIRQNPELRRSYLGACQVREFFYTEEIADVILGGPSCHVVSCDIRDRVEALEWKAARMRPKKVYIR